MHKKITISVESDVLTAFDDMRGIVKRSTYINDLMKGEVDAVNKS